MSDPRKRLIGWIVSFAGALTLYLFTLQTGPGWQDSGGFQTMAMEPFARYVEDFAYGGKLALAHPGYVLIIRLVVRVLPLSPFISVNAVSAVAMAVAVASVFLALTVFFRCSLSAAVCAAFTLAFSHMCWWMGTIAEVYTLSAALLSIEILLLLKGGGRSWLLLAIVTGFHWSVHDFAVLVWPVYAVLFFMQARRKLVAWSILPCAVVLALLGSAPMLYMIARSSEVNGVVSSIVSTFIGDIYADEVIAVGTRWLRFFPVNMGIFSFNFINPLWLLAPVGLFAGGNRVLKAMLAFHFVFFIRYFVADQATFAIPTLLLSSYFVAVGFDRVFRRSNHCAAAVCLAMLALWIPCGYLLANHAVHSRNVEAFKTPVPYRDELRYWCLPWKMNETSAAQFIRDALERTEPDAVFVADVTTYNALTAGMLANPERCGNRKVFCFSEVPSEYAMRPLYIVRPFPGYAAAKYLNREWTRVGCLYRLER